MIQNAWREVRRWAYGRHLIDCLIWYRRTREVLPRAILSYFTYTSSHSRTHFHYSRGNQTRYYTHYNKRLRKQNSIIKPSLRPAVYLAHALAIPHHTLRHVKPSRGLYTRVPPLDPYYRHPRERNTYQSTLSDLGFVTYGYPIRVLLTSYIL